MYFFKKLWVFRAVNFVLFHHSSLRGIERERSYVGEVDTVGTLHSHEHMSPLSPPSHPKKEVKMCQVVILGSPCNPAISIYTASEKKSNHFDFFAPREEAGLWGRGFGVSRLPMHRHSHPCQSPWACPSPDIQARKTAFLKN